MGYPWHQQAWQNITGAALSQRLPHALLLTGVAGLGKRQLAENIARGLLCQSHPLSSNGPHETCDCHSCQLIVGRVHPNVLWVEPEKEGQAIKVDAIREGCDFVAQTSVSQGYRFLIIYPANKMNLNAANALLKTLEEPPSDAVILLVSDQDSCLPATIISRCQRILMHKPDEQTALTWLRTQLKDDSLDLKLLLGLSHGAPLKALALADEHQWPLRDVFYESLSSLGGGQLNPVAAAAQVQALDIMTFLDWMVVCVMDIMRIQTKSDYFIVNRDQTKCLNTLAAKMNLNNVTHYLQTVTHFREQVLSGINSNKTLLMEHLLIKLTECFA